MKTKTQVLKDNPEYKALINAVINRIGMDSVNDVINHGIGGGFSGFIYYVDTVNFYRKHKKDILKLAQGMAGDFGEDMLTMIQNFNCLGKDYSLTEIGQALYSGKGEVSDQILNDMAWFAAEEVCRMFDE